MTKEIPELRPLPASFNEPLDLRGLIVEGRRIPRRGIVANPQGFSYRSAYGTLTAEQGFDTDFASIPRPVWALLPPDDEYTEAAVGHDAGYWHHALHEGGERVPRILVDLIFLSAMKALGVSWWKRWTLFVCVALFGFVAWRKNGRDNPTLSARTGA